MAAATPTRARRAASLAEKFILGAVAGGAAAIAVIDLVLLVQRIVDLVTPGPTVLVDAILNTPLEVESTSEFVTAADADTVNLVVSELPGGSVAALIGAAIVTSLLTIGICLVVAWLCLRVFVGKPFARSATWGIGIAGILVIAAGLFGPFLTAVAHAEAAQALGIDELAPFMFRLDLNPLGWAFVLIAVAAAFEIGQRLQRDQDGLV